jgi:transglutaminase-like putative cysteine protease
MSISRSRRAPLALVALAACCLPSAQCFAAPPLKAHKPTQAAHSAATPGALDPELKAAIASAPAPGRWPNSNYARLLDIGNVTVKSDGTIIAKYRTTYKLFNQRARDLAEVNLPYNASYQDIHVLSARTIRKDGTVVDVKPEDIRVSSPYHEYLMYDDAQGVGFSMPAIEDECIIDYTWEEVTRPMLMPGQFWTYWGFSGLEPVGLCRYVLKSPADKKLNFKVYNDETLKPVVTLSTDGKFKTYTWERSNINPIEVEPGMPRMSDVGSWMEISSLDSWQDVAHWFWGLQSPQARSTPAIKSTVTELIAGKTSDADKARAIYDWVANRTRYVGLEFGLSAFRPHPATEVHDKRYGDCKDKANLLITMLGLAGIKAKPVLLHADERRPASDQLPTLNAFNHCIALAEVAGNDVWLDATAETCAYGDIPYSDRGVQALVVGDGKGEFKTIPTYRPQDNGVDVRSQVTLQADGNAEAAYEVTMRGESGQSLRATVRALTPSQRQEMMSKMAQRFATGGSLKSYTLPDGSDKTGPYVFKMVTTAPAYAEVADDLLIVPIGIAGNAPQTNPYTQESRVWPIVEEDASETHTETTVALPAGYSAGKMPADLDMTNALQEYRRQITKSADGRTVTIVSDMTVHPGRIPAADYPKIKDYYAALLKTANQKIVVKKAP